MTPFGKDTAIGFIGLGVMGSGMAHCLLRAGYRLQVHARNPQAAQPFVAAGATAAATPAALGRGSRLRPSAAASRARKAEPSTPWSEATPRWSPRAGK